MGSPDLTCPRCGAPVDPAAETCGYCRTKRATQGPSAGLDEAGWGVQLASGQADWGPPLSITLPPSKNEHIALRSHALLDDVSARVEYRFDAGQGWAAGLTASALGLCVRASGGAGYDVTVSVAGLISISRYAGGRLAEWLLEPSVHELVREGLGATNLLDVTMVGDRLSARLNGRAVASVRDATLRAGAVELHVRPGAADTRLVVTSLGVSSP